jgi:hypothetical protein
MATTTGSSPASQTLRNVIVGVTTTVLASTIVYFLGFHKSGRSSAESMYFTKEATVQAWKSYVSAENIFFKNWNLFSANYTLARFDHFKKTTLDELNRFKSYLKKILDSKDIDPSLVSLLERRLEAKEDWEDKYKKHLENYEVISRHTDEAERNKRLNEETLRFQAEVKEINQRFGNEIADICTTLTAKNNYTFSWTELQMYQQTTTNNNSSGANTNAQGSAAIDKQMLTGHWKVSDGSTTGNVAHLYQNEDGRMYYYFSTGDSTYGRWELSNNQLTLHYDQYWGAGQAFTYNVNRLTSNSFIITFTASPYNSFNLIRAD